jgi:hypothetical protein
MHLEPPPPPLRLHPKCHYLIHLISMDWFKGKFTGKTHIYWENLWFPVDFPLNQSIDDITDANSYILTGDCYL